MITIKQTKKYKPNYGDYKLFSVDGFAIRDDTICLIAEEGIVVWINDDGFISIINPEDYKYSCDDINVTIGEFLQVIEEISPDEITAVFKNEKDFKITFDYVVE